jgi:pimeloyl-ACP methyl ester carboxylesterase
MLLLGGGADRIGYMHPRAVALLPRAQALWLDGATDFVAEQQPALFANCLTAFIESCLTGDLGSGRGNARTS